LGTLVAEQGRLADPEDVFYLTAAELSHRFPGDLASTVQSRRDERVRYQSFELPTHWQGEVEPIERQVGPHPEPAATTTITLTGVGGSGGIAEGRVRIVDDPTFADVEPDEIIVCATTDPSWPSILFLSKALVVYIGGAMSRAAIVARELGIPCVINTGNGTRVLRSGDLCRVDGTRGVVEVLSRAARGSAATTA
jgi:phosphohistidine swiveling domain-containing protein